MDQTNRLIHEKSPYLLQHSRNPIDWYPWGKEAFAAAIEKDKPIFLSIGYATCHWCHVMEKESFCNEELAEIMNDSFVCIKVDREELPEVDNLYMEFAQALLPNGAGWPLNMFLTPDRKPFFATTYLPPDQGQGMMGLRQVAIQVQELWSGERDLVFEQSQEIVDLFEEANLSKGDDLPTVQTVNSAIDALFEIIDPIYGGIKGAPKFPMSYQLSFLLAYAKTFDDSRTLFFAKLTLDMMRKGGIYDHVGGGFSRYAIDDKWGVPHFEKMLSDNALLASIYLDVFKFSKESIYLDTVSEILEYVSQEMTQESGGFYSAQDADSDGKEGGYYTWSYDEIKEIVPKDHLKIFSDFYGVTKEGNFHGSNVLNCPETLTEFAELLHLEPMMLKEILAPVLKALKAKRDEREKPFLDDKILTSWNSLMIDTFAKAGRALKKEKWYKDAIKAADFIIENLFDDKEEILLRRWRDGQSDYKGLIDDYAFFTKALITLFEMGADFKYLELAERLTNILQERFKETDGAFFMVESDQDLILKKCEFYDGSIPSGNGVHSENLLRLYAITQNKEYLYQAEDIFRAAKTFMESYSPGACYHLLSFERYLHTKTPIIVINLDDKNTYKEELLDVLSTKYLPHTSIVWKRGLSYSYLEEYTLENEKTTIYIVDTDGNHISLTDLNEMKKNIMNL